MLQGENATMGFLQTEGNILHMKQVLANSNKVVLLSMKKTSSSNLQPCLILRLKFRQCLIEEAKNIVPFFIPPNSEDPNPSVVENIKPPSSKKLRLALSSPVVAMLNKHEAEIFFYLGEPTLKDLDRNPLLY